MAKICVSLTEETTAAVVERMNALAGMADLFEIRADRILDLDLLSILRSKPRPLILSCRPTTQGGRWTGDDQRRRMVLLEGVKRGYDYVDIEYLSEDMLDVMMEKSGGGLIVSHHDLERTPEDLDGLYSAMSERGADIVKIAVTPQTVADVGRLLEFAARCVDCGGPPLIAIALGPMGAITRIAAGRYEAPFTYASAAAGSEAAPGQVPVGLMDDLYRVKQVTAATRVYGVLGSEVTRSFSPVLHNRAFEARQVDAVYVPLQADSLEGFIQSVPAFGLAGFSVTRPYKTEILRFLQEVDETAALCGSVNTVVVHEGMLQGSTTDGVGVLAPLKKRLDVKGKDVVVLGAGGAARAAALALQRKGANVTILSRDADRAAFVAESVGGRHGNMAALRQQTWDVLINATPVGSSSAPEESLVPPGLHRPGTIVFDMVYDPFETRLLREAAAAGCTVINGLEMLLAQAVAQFETWTGLEAPLDVMKSAAIYLAQAQEEA